MSQPKPLVRCPRCGRTQPANPSADALYWCDHCRGQFDSNPDEGGDYSDRNPAVRIEREERRKERERENRQHRKRGGGNSFRF